MFSVVIPLWNKRHTLEATVATVLDQSFQDFELVVVDDGSTDGGAELLSSFNDPRIRVLTQANAGPGAARNAGIEAARYDWIAFLDADDLWVPDHLSELDLLRRHFSQAGLIGTAYYPYDRAEPYPPAGPDRSAMSLVDFFERGASGAPLLCSSTAAIPKTTYAELGGFGDCLLGADSEYWARIALEKPVATSTRVTAVYRLGVGGLVDESLRSRRFGPVRGLADLGPLMALLAERYPGIERTPRRAAVDRFVDYRLSLIIRAAAKAGDLAALRAIPGIPPRPPGAADRLILAVADLPPPLARAIYDLGFRAKALFRRLKRRLGAPPSDRFDPLLARHTDYRPDGGRISLLGASHLQG